MNEEFRQTEESASRISYLISGYLRQELSTAEHDELDRWVEASDANMKLFEILTDENYLRAGLEQMNSFDTEARLQMMKKKIDFTPEKRKSKISGLWPYGIAALIAGIAIATYLFLQPQQAAIITKAEIMPAADHTTLSLSDGRVIDLNTVINGKIAAEQGLTLDKQEGLLQYTAGSNSETVYHRLSTGTGGQYSLQLPDGSRVWLNAKSALRFPAEFTGNERRVELEGEGYFEIAKDQDRPFLVVMKDNNMVKVLGTQFNIRSYSDLEMATISLLEGSIEVARDGAHKKLVPGEQLLIGNEVFSCGKMLDSEEVIGWKNQKFVFRDAGIRDIMNELARWYDIKVVYREPVNDLFNATISRQEPLSRFLQLLELTGKIHFTTENNTIYVHR